MEKSFLYSESNGTLTELEDSIVCLPEANGNYVLVKTEGEYSFKHDSVLLIEEIKLGSFQNDRPSLLFIELKIDNISFHCEYSSVLTIECNGDTKDVLMDSLTSTFKTFAVIDYIGKVTVSYKCGCGCKVKLFRMF